MKLYNYDYVRLAPDKQISEHVQPTWELSCVIIGCGERSVGNVREPFVAGDCLLVPPNIPHCWSFNPSHTDKSGRIENITITLKPEFLENIIAVFPETAETIEKFTAYADAVSFEGERAQKIIGIMARMRGETETERAASLLTLIGIIAEKGDRTIGKYGKPDIVKQRLSDISVYVSCNYGRKITVAEAADHTGMNRSAFCSFFKKHTGRTFIEYLTDYRMDTAEKLLREGSMSVTEICYACGFNNISYFSRSFRRHRGLAPSQIRRTDKD